MRTLLLLAAALVAASSANAQRASAVFIDSPSPQILASDSAPLSVTAYDSTGAAIQRATFAWSSSNTAVITVDSNGTVHAVTLGWADIFADTTGARGKIGRASCRERVCLYV